MKTAFLLGALGCCLAAEAATPPRILIIYDMEGVSGIDREELTSFGNPEYAQGRRFLTSDVNAAVRGRVAGGAGPIWVQDGHGSGNSDEPDVLVDQMDPHARSLVRPMRKAERGPLKRDEEPSEHY